MSIRANLPNLAAIASPAGLMSVMTMLTRLGTIRPVLSPAEARAAVQAQTIRYMINRLHTEPITSQCFAVRILGGHCLIPTTVEESGTHERD